MGITLKQLTDSLETVKTYVDNKAPSGGGSGAGDVYYAYEGYSEEEQVIGEYFGKPLYRKTLVYNDTIPASSTAFSIGSVSNIDICVSLSGCAQHNHGTVFTIPCGHPLGNQYDVIPVISDGAVGITTGSSRILTYTKVDVEYTKTTDADDSFTPSMITDNKTIISAAPYFEDYSTEEKCIGRYVDGRPIYKKTIIDKMPSVTTNGEEGINTISIADIKDCVECAAFIQRSETRQIPMYFYKNDNGKDCYQYIATDSNGVEIHNSRTLYNDVPVILHIKYTKTTDAPNSFKPEMITSGIMADEPASDAEVDEIFN